MTIGAVSFVAPRFRPALAAAVLAALVPAGCGGGDGPGAGGGVEPPGRSGRAAAARQRARRRPATQDFLLTTNRGFFRIGRASGAVTQVRATVRAGARSAPVGAFLEVAVAGPRRLVGSGHPDRKGAVRSTSA